MQPSSRFVSVVFKVILLLVIGLPLSGCSTQLDLKQSTGFLLRLSQDEVRLASDGTESLLVTATPVNGVEVASGAKGCGTVFPFGLPAGISATWSQPTVSNAGVVQWKLSLSESKSLADANSTLYVAAHITDARTGKIYTNVESVALAVTSAASTLKFSPAHSPVQIVQGTSAEDSFSFSSSGSFQGSPTLAISGLPQGVNARWSSNPVAMSNGKGDSTLTLTPSVAVSAQRYTFTVTATADGLSVANTYTLVVEPTDGIQIATPSPISITSMGTGSTTVSATLMPGVSVAPGAIGSSATITSTLPPGITATWSSPSTKTAGEVQWNVTLTGSPTAIGWSGWVLFSVHVTDAATGVVFAKDQHIALAVKLVAPTLAALASTSSIYVSQGSSAADTFSFAGGGSYHGNLTLSVTGLPKGISASWSQNPVALNSDAGTSILTLTAGPEVTAQQYSFTVSATGDGQTAWNYLRVFVEPQVGVTLQVAQPSIRVVPGVASTMTVTAHATNDVSFASNGSGVQAQVTSQLPSGVTAQWSAPVITQSGTLATWQLTLNAATSATSGICPVTVASTVTDQASGMSFSAHQQFSMYLSLLGEVNIGSVPGKTIATDFMGLSQEWGNTYRFMGSTAVGVNQAYRQLLINLAAYGSDPVHIRMGGNSTDLSGTPSKGTDAPLADLAAALHNQFIIGVNLGSDNASLAVAQAQNDVNQMPVGSIAALEIGNEPDLYDRNGLRPTTYTFQDYLNDFDTWKAAIEPILPANVKLAGPAWAATASLANLPAFLSAEAPSLSVVTQHYYATNPGANPPADVLLQPKMATQEPDAVAAAVSEAHASGLQFRMGELGSVDDQGIEGISDAFGSALWAVDTMFEYANVGVDGVNWETSSGNYDHPFFFETATTGGITSYTLTSVSPLYYGMLLFQQATANHSSLLPATVDTTANLKCWPTVDSNGTHRLTILNKDETQSGAVAVNLPGYSVATISRLTAPSYTSTTGVTLGGQTFDTSVDGKIQGSPTTETVQGINGMFSIPMPVTSAALVVFSN